MEGGAILPNTQIEFTVDGIKNPISTAPLPGIVISIYGPGGGKVDETSTFLKVTNAA
jgi:hypothetical protein